MMSVEMGDEYDHSPSVLQLDVDPTDDGEEEDRGGLLRSPRELLARYASSSAASLSLSSALTPTYSNRSRLVACEYEEICSERWLPMSPSSSSVGIERDVPDHSPAMPSLSESYSQTRSTNRNIVSDDSGALDKLNNSDREDTSNKGGGSSDSRKESGKGKRSNGLIARIYMRFWGKKSKRINDDPINKYLDHEMFARKFTYKELASATNNFSPELRLGQGGFGVVYKGFLKDMKLDVAIKRISNSSRQGEKEYLSEIRVLGQLRHKNLVPFVGWCHEHEKLLLVYEYMTNGTLDSHIYSSINSPPLNWKTRYGIVLGLASALLYLHEGWIQCVVHRDIKPSNILLDSEFNARLTDFGLARLIDSTDDFVTTNVAGTLGYLAPEYVVTGVLSKESDIYSFGIVVLETACGRKSIIRNTDFEAERHLLEWVWDLHGVGRILEAADKRLEGDFDENQMWHLLLVGLWCCHPDKGSRPNARQVIKALTFVTQVPTLPLTMPVAVYHSLVPNHGNSFSGSVNSQTFSHTTTDSFDLRELSVDHTQIFEEQPQSSIHIIDEHPETSTSKHEDSKSLPPADEEEQCTCQVGSSVPTTATDHEDNQRVDVEFALAQETFDIGISMNYASIGPLQPYQLPIIKGLIASLYEILKSDPKFDEVMDSVRKFTSMLAMVGAPLDGWNSLAQYVLQNIKEIDNLKLKMEDEVDPSSGILSYLLDEVDSYEQAIVEDAQELSKSHLQLHHALQEHDSLSAEYTELQKQLIFLQKRINDAEDTCISVLKEVNIIETRRDWNQTRLESVKAAAASSTQQLQLKKEESKRRISALFESMLSRIASFSVDM